MSKNPFQYNRVEAELVHACYYQLHWDLVAATESIRAGLMRLHEAEVRSHGEDRQVLKRFIADLEKHRDSIDATLLAASNSRTDMIRITGCDRKCCDEPSYRPKTGQRRTKTDQEPANGLQTAPEGES